MPIPSLEAAINANSRAEVAATQLFSREGELECSIRATWITLRSTLQAAAGAREPLGELLVLAGRITRAQLDAALQERSRSPRRLGEILVKRGLLSGAEMRAVLEFQRDQQGTDGPLRLGNLLVALGAITAEQLADALERQSETRKPLGAVLVEAGYAHSGQVSSALSLQRRLLQGALVAALSLCVVNTPTPARAGQTSRSLSVSATVLPVVQLDVQEQPDTLTITQADVGRGYVEVAAGVTLLMKTNTRQGVVLRFSALPGLFKAVHVTGFASGVELGGEGGAVIQRPDPHAPVKLQLGYRFVLTEAAQAGSYPWPVAVSAQPL